MSSHRLDFRTEVEICLSALRAIEILAIPDAHISPARDELTALMQVVNDRLQEALQTA